MWRLLALPPLPKEVLEQLLGDPRLEVVVPESREQGAAEALLPEVDLVLSDWTQAFHVADPGPRVAFVQVPRVGTDQIDLEACSARGVPVSNCAGANSVAVAEWCLAATFALLRQTVEGDAAVRRGEWPQTSLPAFELSGQRVGVVGMGGVGRAVAQRYQALGCDVAYWSRSKHDVPWAYRDLDDLLGWAQLVVLVIALGDETRGLVGADRLRLMSPQARLVSAGRGPVLDEPALAEALAAGRLAGAALDVFAVEPLPEESPLRAAPNLLLSPHLAGSTGQAQLNILTQSRANLHRVLDGEPVVDVVNGVPPEVRRR